MFTSCLALVMISLKSNPNPIKFMHKQLKTGGVIALLASTLAFSPSAFALNTTIGNSFTNIAGSGSNNGQSFINDPSGTGATINLDTWTFAFINAANQTTAAASTLTIYSGTGNGGTVVGTSSNTSTLNFGSPSFPAVTWTFTGGLQIIDNQTYTAVLAPNLGFRFTASSVYPNGVRTSNTTGFSNSDTVFQGTFSAATPVPFEFSPALGLGVLGGLFALKRFVKKKKAS
jgi:hypothetical protein